MNKNPIVRLIMKKLALLTLGIILLFAAPACSQDKGEAQNATAPAASEEAAPPAATTATSTGQTGHEGMDMGAADNMAPGMHEQYSDKIFLSMMIPHHSGAVAMCNDVLKDGKDPQVKAWAEEMNKAQQGEIVIMLKWLEDLGGKDKAAWDRMSEEMRAMREHVMSADPDMNFVLMMIPHHAMALEMAYPALVESNDPKVVDMAKDIIVHQAEEIRAMRNWLDERKPAADASEAGSDAAADAEGQAQP